MRISDWSSDVCSSDLGFSTYWHLQELPTLARAEAQAAALQVAEIATVPLARAELGALQRIASVANQRQGFNHDQIISADGRVLAGAGRPGDADTGTRILTQPIPAAHAGGAPGMMRIEISLRDVFAAQRAQALKALLLLACGLVAAGLIVWRSARRLGA